MTLDEFDKIISDYHTKRRRFRNQIDAWYAVASQKYAEGDSKGQLRAYDKIDKLVEEMNALPVPLGLEGEIPDNLQDLDLNFSS